MLPLFLKRAEVVKRAQPEGGELPRNVSEWPMRLRDEWLKVAPYAFNYPTTIDFDEMSEAGKGTAFGHLSVTSKTGMGINQALGQMGVDFGVRTVKVPFIVENFRIYPMDMLMTEEGKFLPLNEERLSEALFRPTTFDIPTKPEGNQMFGNPVYPPNREKAAAFPILFSIADTIHADQLDRRGELLAKDAGLRGEAVSNPVVRSYLEVVANVVPREPLSKVASGLTAAFNPDVVLVQRLEGPVYRVKTAMRRAYEPVSLDLDRGHALRTFGEETVKEADVKGMVIIIRRRSDEGEPSLGPDSPFEMMRGDGPGRVLGPGHKPMHGWVLSKVLNALTGDRSPFRLFSDGEHFGLGDDMGALPCGKEPSPLKASETPSGTGTFCWTTEKGETECTEPVKVLIGSSLEGRQSCTCETMDGRRVEFVRSSQAKTVVPGSEKVLLPEKATWVSLGDKMIKVGTARDLEVWTRSKLASTSCLVRFEKDAFHIEGHPLRKIGSLEHLGPYDALFACGLMGLSKESALRALAHAVKHGSIRVYGVREVSTLDDLRKEAFEKVAVMVKDDPTLAEIDRLADLELLKFAASLGDPGSVDAMLSIGFLNLDNVSRFVTYIPHIQDVQSQIGNLLLAARLGLSELPQDQLVRSFYALEHVLSGLRRVSIRLESAQA